MHLHLKFTLICQRNASICHFMVFLFGLVDKLFLHVDLYISLLCVIYHRHLNATQFIY